MTPRATYRLQFHAGFRFADAIPLVGYLDRLGISHVYASPIATARAGSMHGYDVVDPTMINPELGGEAGFRDLAAALQARGMGLILDIVPNHMAVGGADNDWWLDVLEQGKASAFAGHFDIDWQPADPALHGKLLAPFLGAPYAEVLASGDLVIDTEPDRLSVLAYGSHRFPLRRDDYAGLLADVGAAALDPASAAAIVARHDGRDDAGRARLHALLERQHYRLAWWRVAGDEINWRRFFDITELAGLRIEDDAVFDVVHALPLRLYREGLIDGLRVDHVDGLADPAGYCRRLRAALAGQGRDDGPAYLVVEKILAEGERLSPDWQTDGTSGYDAMNDLAALLHAPRGAAPLTAYWHQISGRPAAFAVEEKAARIEIVTRSFGGQLKAAVVAFHRVARSDLATRDLTAGAIRRALVALLAVFPSYRSYGTGAAGPDSDGPLLAQAVAAAAPAAAPGEAAVLDQIAGWLRGQGPGAPGLRRDAVRRFQQLSAPVSAKAVEDTAFYRYGRLLSRTDVGFDPGRFSVDAAGFAAAVQRRAADFPQAMLATATHDHKRGEDVRARLAVLSEVPDAWLALVRRWAERHRDAGVDPADAYLLYQTLVGAWPLALGRDDRAGLAGFAARVVQWQQKALREAKLRSSWTVPDECYERRCAEFVGQLLAPDSDGPFLAELLGFVAQIAPAGAANGLVQAVLRCTLPGMPDTYQGTEFWDLSLVDPDNRRPVDYAPRIAGLDGPDDIASLLAGWRDGRIKQHMIADALDLRRRDPALFTAGSFEPVEVRGLRARHVFAFVRRHGDSALLVAVALHRGQILFGAETPALPAGWWGDTELRGELRLPVADLLGTLPAGLRRL